MSIIIHHSITAEVDTNDIPALSDALTRILDRTDISISVGSELTDGKYLVLLSFDDRRCVNEKAMQQLANEFPDTTFSGTCLADKLAFYCVSWSAHGPNSFSKATRNRFLDEPGPYDIPGFCTVFALPPAAVRRAPLPKAHYTLLRYPVTGRMDHIARRMASSRGCT